MPVPSPGESGASAQVAAQVLDEGPEAGQLDTEGTAVPARGSEPLELPPGHVRTSWRRASVPTNTFGPAPLRSRATNAQGGRWDPEDGARPGLVVQRVVQDRRLHEPHHAARLRRPVKSDDLGSRNPSPTRRRRDRADSPPSRAPPIPGRATGGSRRPPPMAHLWHIRSNPGSCATHRQPCLSWENRPPTFAGSRRYRPLRTFQAGHAGSIPVARSRQQPSHREKTGIESR